MITLIRVEQAETGAGLWHAEDINGELIYKKITNQIGFRARHNEFPTPYDDAGIKDAFETGKHFCGFKSVEQLQQWVTINELKDFISMGMRVYLIDVHDYLEGEHQYVYMLKDVLQKKDITSLFV